MKRLFPVIFAAFLCACGDTNPNKVVVLDFDVTRLSPLMFRFDNLSSGFDDYKWDFGDGSFSLAPDYALYEFEAVGDYTVTLIGYIDGVRYERSKSVSVSKPIVCFAGFTLYSIPYENRYYRLSFKDDDLFPSAWDFYTNYTSMIDNTDLPYTYMFGTPVPTKNIENRSYYTIQVLRNTNTSTTSNEVSCLKQQLKVKEILTYKPEYILQTETGNTIVGIHMEYIYP